MYFVAWGRMVWERALCSDTYRSTYTHPMTRHLQTKWTMPVDEKSNNVARAIGVYWGIVSENSESSSQSVASLINQYETKNRGAISTFGTLKSHGLSYFAHGFFNKKYFGVSHFETNHGLKTASLLHPHHSP